MPTALVSSGAFPAQVGQSGTFTSADVLNTVARGVKVILSVTANAGGLGSVVLKIQGRDVASGSYYDLLTSAALSAVATSVFTLNPSITAVANQAVRDALPAVWRVTVSGNGSPTSYSVGFTMVP